MENSDNLHITPVEELLARKERLQRLLQEKRIDGAIILQRADLFYFSGTGQDGYLLIPASGESVLLVRKSFERARRESRLSGVEKFRGSKALPGAVDSIFRQPRTIGMELDVVPANHYLRFRTMFPEPKLLTFLP